MGTIKLEKNPELGLDIFEWCGILAESRSAIQGSLDEVRAKATRLEATVDGLKAQLQEFIAAKESDETELLEKFKTLLNEKKVKIREQQKLLTAARENPSVVLRREPRHGGKIDDEELNVKDEPMEEEEVAAPSARRTRKATPATKKRQGKASIKRKISQVEPESSSAGSEPMDVDQDAPLQPVKQEPLSSGEERMTEEEDETADEPDSDMDDQPTAPAAAGSSSSHTMRGSQDTNPVTATASSAPAGQNKIVEMPPRRELPIGIRRGTNKPPPRKASPKAAGDDETDSDDEL